MQLMFRTAAISRRWLALCFLAGLSLADLAGAAGPTGPAATPAIVDIANLPLYGGRAAHPNVAVTLSVEFPSVGAAYLGVAYVRSSAYLGYFDSTKCYTYVNASGGYFTPTSLADSNHECVDAFSGNFMNWVSMSAIDEFRYAMTGGNRVDENGPSNGTILQRAYLPDGALDPGVPDFYNYYIFPAQALPASNAVLPQSINAPAAGGTIFIHSCKAQIFFGAAFGGNCSNPSADFGLGSYNVRVNVCTDTEGPLRPDLCLQYGGSTGRYKPVGQAQLNADRMRFAAFGYLLDRNNAPPNEPVYTIPPNCDPDGVGWNRCRYGGVLRAPMKYVGPVNYDANLVQSVNAANEVNSDGTLVANPENNAASFGGQYSGFINFINKYGSTGVYKRYDTMGEMYYEAIRYFQNLQPTPDAFSGPLTNAVADYFPYATSWTDPIQSACSANYILNLSDTNTWDDSYLPGYNGIPSPGLGRASSRPVTGGLDANDWARRIGVLESDPTINSITPNDIQPALAGMETRHTGDSGIHSFYLSAGAAYWANNNDIRTDLTGTQTIKTLSFDVGQVSNAPTPLPQQQLQLYLMGKYGGFINTIDRPSDTSPDPFFATNPANPSSSVPIRSNSEWESTAGSGTPANYFLASDPQKLINGIRSAFGRITAASGTLAGAALTSTNLTYGSAGAYVATFDPTSWSGSVQLITLTLDASGNLVPSTFPVWDSGSLLTARCGIVTSGSTVCADSDTSVNKRNIVTTISQGGVRTAVPFTYAGVSGDPAYLATLNTNPATGVVDTLGQRRLDYLRGDRVDEATSLFRVRSSPMGDVINSGPVYVGPPSSAIPDADYQVFFTTNAARTAAVYVGANDGMLHAFRADNGFELFAYVPGFERPDLNALTNPGYQHEVFVDTTPKVQEAEVNGTWKTILVGANGNGAQGIFALDVSDPDSFGPNKVLFEFSDADDPDFGNTLAAPEFAKLLVSGATLPAQYRYFAVVTGYNNTRTTVNGRPDSSVSTDTTNQGVLFLIALDHTLNTPWVQNRDYYKYTFPATNPALPNGLAPVTLLASKSGDRSTASMYFGDLQGNLWKFNTATGDPTTFASAVFTSTTTTPPTTTAPGPIFVAQDSSGNRQPITARVELANGPFGGTLVYFGTGKYLGQTDLTLPAGVQSEYSLLDVNPSVLITRATDLVPRVATLSGQNVLVTGSSFSYSGTSSKKGWYLDFPSSTNFGERSITKPAIRTGLLTFTTLTLSNDLCAPGNGFVYQVNALTGLQVDGSLSNVIGYTSTVGIPGPPRVVDLTLIKSQSQVTGEVINLKTQTTLVSGTANKIGSYGSQTPIKVPPTQQLNWREITNWNDRTGR